ncbi:terminase [Paraburkholderia tropica]|uniref:terminase n=1 Tax=Paraburkholderia tropica TaxID=92647 RepID=UPI002AB5EE8A|nr:terminase [Paraburkholderia tropica]
MARPSKYRPEFDEQARKLCLLGATDIELADFFETTEQTINTWKIAHPEFLESIKKGKAQADADVADRLYQRAMGFTHPEIDLRVVNGGIVETPITKIYPPDTAAAIFWLKNRQRGKWRDKVEQEITGKDGSPLIPGNPNEMTDEQLAAIAAGGGSATPRKASGKK